jgi:hypothetical protein
VFVIHFILEIFVDHLLTERKKGKFIVLSIALSLFLHLFPQITNTKYFSRNKAITSETKEIQHKHKHKHICAFDDSIFE